MSRFLRPALLMPLAAALALSACGKSEQSITVKDADGKDQTVTVGEQGGTTTLKSEDGSAEIRQGDDAAKAASFPAHAPQYPGSTVVTSANFAGKEGETGAMTVQETSDDPAKVMAFYKEKVAAAGKKVAMETTTPDGGMLGVEGAGGSNSMMISVARGGDKTSITYIAGQ